jgi:two-component system sensor histidine kinase/response regulator
MTTTTPDNASFARVLIVDDQPDNLRLLSRMLLRHGYVVRTVMNGRMALDSIKVEPPDIILLDINMPEMNGYQVCQEIKGNQQMAHIPVIFVSAMDAAIDKVRAFEAGGSDYISKPFQVDEVLARVENQLTMRRNQQEITQLNAALRQRANELEAANAELESFSHSVAHDLRTPLWTIDMMSEALLEDYSDALDEKAQNYVQRIRGNAHRMLHLIEALLTLSQVTCSDLHWQSVNLSVLAQEILEELQQQAPERLLDARIMDDIIVAGDARLLRIVLENLLSNAWKFTQQASQAIIEVGTLEQAADMPLTCFVRDNGVGFDMAQSHRLFGTFQRLHEKSEFAGTGIGLATVKRIIIRHGGNVWAESTPGAWTTFFFTLQSR